MDETNQAPQATPERGLPIWLSEAALLAAIPVVGYLITYIYEASFCSYFDIPLEFILLSPAQLFMALVVVLGFCLLYGGTLELYFKYHPALGSLFPALLGALVTQDWYRGPFVLHLIPWYLAMLITTLLRYWYEMRKAAEQEGADANGSSSRSEPHHESSPQALLVRRGLILVTVSLPFAFSFGVSDAKKRVRFLVTDTKPPLAMLRIYGERLICAPVDLKAKRIKRDFSLLTLGEDFKNKLKLRAIGPLTVER